MGEDDLQSRFGSFVYFLCVGDEVVYVGQTGDLQARLYGHNNRFAFDAVYVLGVPQVERLAIEYYWIGKLRPKYNRAVTDRPVADDLPDKLPGASLSEQMRYALNRCPQSLGAIAKSSGIHESTISRFRAGSRTLSQDALDSLCMALGLTVVKVRKRKKG
jgi:hypothetical protein